MKIREISALVLSLLLLNFQVMAENEDQKNDQVIAEEQITTDPASGEVIAKSVQNHVSTMVTTLNGEQVSMDDPRVQQILKRAGIKIDGSDNQSVLVIPQQITPELVQTLESTNEELQKVVEEEELPQQLDDEAKEKQEREELVGRIDKTIDNLNRASVETGISFEQFLDKNNIKYEKIDGEIVFTEEPSEEFAANLEKAILDTREQGELKQQERQLMTELNAVNNVSGGDLLVKALKAAGIKYKIVAGRVIIAEELSPEYIEKLKDAQTSLRKQYVAKTTKPKSGGDSNIGKLSEDLLVRFGDKDKKVQSRFSAEVIAGYLAGNKISQKVIQGKVKFHPIAGVKIGPQLILGNLENGFNLLHGKQKVNLGGLELGSSEGTFLGYTYNVAKKKHKFTIASTKGKAAVNRWLNLGAGVDLGVVSYKKEGTFFYLTPSIGAEAHRKLGPVNLTGDVDVAYQIAERSTILSCGGEASLDILNNDSINLSAAAVGRMSLESSPMSYGNGREFFGGVVIGGEF